jgi:hypothetical protein
MGKAEEAKIKTRKPEEPTKKQRAKEGRRHTG